MKFFLFLCWFSSTHTRAKRTHMCIELHTHTPITSQACWSKCTHEYRTLFSFISAGPEYSLLQEKRKKWRMSIVMQTTNESHKKTFEEQNKKWDRNSRESEKRRRRRRRGIGMIKHKTWFKQTFIMKKDERKKHTLLFWLLFYVRWYRWVSGMLCMEVARRFSLLPILLCLRVSTYSRFSRSLPCTRWTTERGEIRYIKSMRPI